MELKQLEYFVAAAEELSFTRAARRRHVVQSAISTQVKALETELGVSLFDRSTQKISLTQDGELLLERARGILKSVDETRELLAPDRAELRGRLTIGVTQGAWRGMVTALTSYRAAHPHVRIELRQAPIMDLFAAVSDGALDVAVVPLRRTTEPGLLVRQLHSEVLTAVVGPMHPLAGRESVSLTELAELDLVGFTSTWALRAMTDRGFERARVAPHLAYEVNDVNTAADIVLSGLAAMVLTTHLADRFENLVHVPLVETIEWRVGVIASERRCTRAAAALMELLA
ncbi:LysR family transcriptional regulator [Cryobacterium soli]|uniref:LysR family transcriptional regulator n=1 Tax=Cryobacterium soli TaxID=2220095 RepID=UPI000E76CF56|nr:LysR family transcriptional regulator [Cryobacterium soli]